MTGPARGGAEDDVLRRIPDVAALQAALDDVDYLADPGLATALFLAVRLPQPILLEGELAELEAAWKQAEEIAAIADEMFVGDGVLGRLQRLKRRDAR